MIYSGLNKNMIQNWKSTNKFRAPFFHVWILSKAVSNQLSTMKSKESVLFGQLKTKEARDINGFLPIFIFILILYITFLLNRLSKDRKTWELNKDNLCRVFLHRQLWIVNFYGNFLFCEGQPWTKIGSENFDVLMGSHDRASTSSTS